MLLKMSWLTVGYFVKASVYSRTAIQEIALGGGNRFQWPRDLMPEKMN